MEPAVHVCHTSAEERTGITSVNLLATLFIALLRVLSAFFIARVISGSGSASPASFSKLKNFKGLLKYLT